MYHPETGGEFDAPERAVPLWQRSGWAVKEPPSLAGATGSSSGQAAGFAGTTSAADDSAPDQES